MQRKAWIPAFAGMTADNMLCVCCESMNLRLRWEDFEITHRVIYQAISITPRFAKLSVTQHSHTSRRVIPAKAGLCPQR